MTFCSGTLSGWNPGSKNHSCERKKCPERGPVREQRTSTRFGVSADTSRFKWFLQVSVVPSFQIIPFLGEAVEAENCRWDFHGAKQMLL